MLMSKAPREVCNAACLSLQPPPQMKTLSHLFLVSVIQRQDHTERCAKGQDLHVDIGCPAQGLLKLHHTGDPTLCLAVVVTTFWWEFTSLTTYQSLVTVRSRPGLNEGHEASTYSILLQSYKNPWMSIEVSWLNSLPLPCHLFFFLRVGES